MSDPDCWVGIRHETKTDNERRAPLTPECVQTFAESEGLGFCVEPSPTRVFRDEEYAAAGALIDADLSRCNLIIGIKEVAPEWLLAGKAYLYFSHTIKGQRYNMPLLAAVLERGCTLLDYERVIDDRGRRLIFFGVQAGQAGMINTLWALGRRLAAQGLDSPFAALKQAREYHDLDEARAAVRAAGAGIARGELPPALTPFVCGFAGYGNVSSGAQEIYDLLGVEAVAPPELAGRVAGGTLDGRKAWKVVFREEHMVHRRAADAPFELQEYYDHPERYAATFAGHLPYLGALINATYWDARYPRFVSREDLAALGGDAERRLQVIGDITCDPGGGFECTVKATLPDDPCYVYDPRGGAVRDGFEGPGVQIMAVDILPTELPRESSQAFSDFLAPYLAEVARADYSQPFEQLSLPAAFHRAVIAHRGELTPDYRYIAEFLAAR